MAVADDDGQDEFDWLDALDEAVADYTEDVVEGDYP